MRSILFSLALLLGVPLACTCNRPDGGGLRGKPPVVVVDPDETAQGKTMAEVEPNDKTSLAQGLPAGVWVEGTLVEGKGQQGDRDLYRVEVKDPGRILSATLRGTSGLDLVLEAIGGKRERLVRVNNSREGEGEVLANLAVEEGPIWLLVREAKGRSAPGRYKLSYTIRPREEGEEREPNSKSDLASPLSLGGEAIGYLGWMTDTDWYRVELKGIAPGSRLRVEYDGLDEVKANLSVRDATGAVVQERWGGRGEAIVLPNLAPREGETMLYLVVRCQYTFNVESRYSLRVLAQVPPGPTEAEPNDRPINASSIDLARPIAAHILDPQDKDTFSLKVDRAQLVRVQLVPPFGLDVALSLIDESGNTLWQVDAGGPRGAEEMPTLWVRPPRALFQVHAPRRQHASANAPYHLKVESINGSGWEREPNGSPATATPWTSDQPAISGHIHPSRDVDHFRVTAQSGKVALSMAGVPKLSLKMELLELASGKAIAASADPDGKGVIHLEARTEAGSEYILRVSENSDLATAGEAYRITRDSP